MSKVVRLFANKQRATAWINRNKNKYKGKIIGGSTYAKNSGSYYAYVFGEITQEMADDMRPRSTIKTYFEYKQ